MGLQYFTDAKRFLERILPILGENEILHNLILGIASRLVDLPDVHTEPVYMAVVEREGALRLAALMTPPRDLLFAAVGEPDERDVQLIVKNLTGRRLAGARSPCCRRKRRVVCQCVGGDEWDGL